jgi:hypothetical protein
VCNDSSNRDSETVVAAQGFIKFLTSLETAFLLVIFSKIFCYTDVLFNILQSKHFDILYCSQKVQETRREILNLRNTYDLIWIETLACHNDDESPPSKRHCREEDPTISRKSIYNDIFDNIVVQLQERFGFLPQLQFTSLLDPLKYEVYRTIFPVSAFETLKQTHKDLFDFVRLKNELTVLYSFEDFL